MTAVASLPAKRTEVRGQDSFSYLVFRLADGESIKAEGGTMMYMKGGIELESTRAEGFKRFFGRVLAGQSGFQNIFRGKKGGGGVLKVGGRKSRKGGADANGAEELSRGRYPVGTVALAGVLPGGVQMVTLQRDGGGGGIGDRLAIGRRAFLCCDEHVEIGGRGNLKGLFEIGQEVGAVVAGASLPESGPSEGRVWISAFGTVERHVLAQDEVMIVDNGMFLASNVWYDVVSPSSLFGLVFSGEGFAMKFKGPGVVYTQSRNINEFSAYLKPFVSDNRRRGEIVMEGGAPRSQARPSRSTARRTPARSGS